MDALEKFLTEHDRLCNWNTPPFTYPITCSCGRNEADEELAALRAQVARVEALVVKWKQAAHAAVPPEYSNRDLHAKYLKLDNAAAGWDDCADELAALLAREAK